MRCCGGIEFANDLGLGHSRGRRRPNVSSASEWRRGAEEALSLLRIRSSLKRPAPLAGAGWLQRCPASRG
eukprot:11699029-Alexandrium_andersonii.AAC.1